MAATTEMKCAACGERHTFYLVNADIFPADTEYEYTCPKMQTWARLTANEQFNPAAVQWRPRGSVVVKQVNTSPRPAP
jgi:hypothetical protein